MLRTGILILLALALVVIMIASWGSIGSIAMLMCLLLLGSSLLYQHFLTNRDEDQWQMD